ncbi:TPA: hypothetical protein IAC10_04640 [Candidatus Scatousia excrementigallinarum]|uniref:Uncharacterized protein n=1 Tax=Candidatus Scatousia excrementigallinarum TaxID=2840935 RepID=A0A9D1JN70_9BACT|nr:hypothetical protein [Candidatus Scatousia excrementigallinarum]
MFYVIKDEKLYEFGDNVNQAWDYPEDAKELTGVTLSEFYRNMDKYKVQDSKLVDVSQTEEYLARSVQEQKSVRKQEIQNKLTELDIKCIRAMREGGNDEDGTPFIDKYQAEIISLREEYNSL